MEAMNENARERTELVRMVHHPAPSALVTPEGVIPLSETIRVSLQRGSWYDAAMRAAGQPVGGDA